MVRIILITFLLVAVCFSNGVYVRDGDSGSGTSWFDALDQIPATISRGDTVYVGDGVYVAYICNDAVSGSDYIYIVKATGSSHGTSTGWQASYGDGQAVFPNINITTNYWVIDGQTRITVSSGHGFKIVNTTSDTPGIDVSDGMDYITIKYTEITTTITSGAGHTETGFQIIGGTNIYLGYNHFHDLSGPMCRVRKVDGIVIEHNFYDTNNSWPTGPHGDGQQVWGDLSGGLEDEPALRNAVVRWNIFKEIEGTGDISFEYGAKNCHVYGNIFYLLDNTTQDGCGNGMIRSFADPDEPRTDQFYVYNNTFYNISKNKSYIWITNPTGNSLYAYNNLWYKCNDANSVSVDGFTAFGYNYISDSVIHWNFTPAATTTQATGDPFTDSGNFDLSLSSGTDDGIDITAQGWYDIDYDSPLDINGNTRGSDGVWDRGAYEYTASGGSELTQSGKVVKIGNQTYD